MICTFCGNENLSGNRFCGMCGVRLERRKAERRAHESGSTKCGSCGHVNESRNKFCGMCGARIDRRTQERRGSEQKSRATAMANAQLPTPDARKPVVHSPALTERSSVATMGATALAERPDFQGEERRIPVTSVGGPSFLGLNEPQPEGDYLLEEEGSSGRGIRNLVLLVILAGILGLIYVQYRSNLNASPNPSAPKTAPTSMPSHGKVQQPGTDKGMAAVAGASTLQAATLEMAKAANSSAADKNSDTATEKDSKTTAEKPVKAKVPSETVADNDAQGKTDPVVATKTQPSPALVKAQQYLHGRGVRQSCEQGLVYLKAATKENDPQAAVQMAALYSSGFCVQQDRVKAYQWFSSAQEMNPENRWITKNMSQLWAQMTSEERRQVR